MSVELGPGLECGFYHELGGWGGPLVESFHTSVPSVSPHLMRLEKEPTSGFRGFK